MNECDGGVGLAAGKQRVPGGRLTSDREDTTAPGSRRHPPRSGLTRGERGNPVEVPPSNETVGRPTVRDVEFLSGPGWLNKRMPVRRKATGNQDSDGQFLRWPSWITGRIPGLVPGPERGQT
jgi:hypothetical protein